MASWVAVMCGGRVAALIDMHRSGNGRFERRDCFGGVDWQGRWVVSEKPRHVEREAGLIITFDLCPVTPGSYTRLSTSFADQHVVCGLANR
jgi:hypothetical protein